MAASKTEVYEGDNGSLTYLGGSSAPKVELSASEYNPDPEVVNTKGEKIKLNDGQKNAIYKESLYLKEKIKGSLCTKDECDHPTEHNIRKMQKEMAMSGLVERHRNSLKVVGADPSEYNYDSMRSRGNHQVKYFSGLGEKHEEIFGKKE